MLIVDSIDVVVVVVFRIVRYATQAVFYRKLLFTLTVGAARVAWPMTKHKPRRYIGVSIQSVIIHIIQFNSNRRPAAALNNLTRLLLMASFP